MTSIISSTINNFTITPVNVVIDMPIIPPSTQGSPQGMIDRVIEVLKNEGYTGITADSIQELLGSLYQFYQDNMAIGPVINLALNRLKQSGYDQTTANALALVRARMAGTGEEIPGVSSSNSTSIRNTLKNILPPPTMMSSSPSSVSMAPQKPPPMAPQEPPQNPLRLPPIRRNGRINLNAFFSSLVSRIQPLGGNRVDRQGRQRNTPSSNYLSNLLSSLTIRINFFGRSWGNNRIKLPAPRSRTGMTRRSAARPSASRPSASRPSASRPSASRPSSNVPSSNVPSSNVPSSNVPSASRPPPIVSPPSPVVSIPPGYPYIRIITNLNRGVWSLRYSIVKSALNVNQLQGSISVSSDTVTRVAAQVLLVIEKMSTSEVTKFSRQYPLATKGSNPIWSIFVTWLAAYLSLNSAMLSYPEEFNQPAAIDMIPDELLETHNILSSLIPLMSSEIPAMARWITLATPPAWMNRLNV